MKDSSKRYAPFEEADTLITPESALRLFQGGKVLFFGAIALLASVVEIPLGIFTHGIAEFISNVWEKSFTYVVTVFTVLAALPLVLSLGSAILSCAFYKASKKSFHDRLGLGAAIFSIVLCCLSIALYALSFFA